VTLREVRARREEGFILERDNKEAYHIEGASRKEVVVPSFTLIRNVGLPT